MKIASSEAALQQEKGELQLKIANLQTALQQERGGLETALQQQIQINASLVEEKAELQRRIASLETSLGQFQAKFNIISEVMKMEVANPSI